MQRILFGGFMLMMACNPKAPQPVEDLGKHIDMYIHGHRGARGLMPENSVEGFLLALSLGVDVLEMDVVITADSQVVVSHEPWISASICLGADEHPIDTDSQLDLNIYRMTYAQVRRYDCGSLPDPDFALQQRLPTYKPLLSEVIAKVEAKRKELDLPPVRYSIETKCSPPGDGLYHPTPAVFSRLLMAQIKASGAEATVMVQSFDVRTLREFHANWPNIPLALLVAEPKDPKAETDSLGFVPDTYSPNFRGLNAQLVASAQALNMKVVPWTVNDEADMIDLVEMGIDGLITDYPDLAITVRQ